MTAIAVRVDSQRGCGWRKPGGIYLVADGPSTECGRLPLRLSVCPTCSCGIKPTRGWTWVDADALFADVRCQNGAACSGCPLSLRLGRVGLLWVGTEFYPTPSAWTHEAVTQGVSRRISAVPRDFKVGETLVLVAHRMAIHNSDGTFSPGVFHAFRPTAVEYVVRGNETEKELQDIVDRGITPVRVVRDEGLLSMINRQEKA